MTNINFTVIQISISLLLYFLKFTGTILILQNNCLLELYIAGTKFCGYYQSQISQNISAHKIVNI